MAMLDTAIIGGGLCGMALARSLHRSGHTFTLFEARARLGGRAYTVTCPKTDLAMDLGPAWFWPHTQPLVTGLVAELGLEDFPQNESGALLYLRDPDKKPDAVDGTGIHYGARRIEGGVGNLIGAIARELPAASIHLEHALKRIYDRGDHVSMEFACRGRVLEVCARRVVLAVPPRLLQEAVLFAPPIDAATAEAMRETATWMAAQAKVVIAYDRPFWRDAGQSGNAFVTHEQAVLGEIFDASDAAAQRGALGGFVALSPELRRSFSAGLPMLMASQMVQVFGGDLDAGEQHYCDWSAEPFTCSTLDMASPATQHTGLANPLLRRSFWDGKLFLAGSETASYGAGYLEGALDAANRIERQLLGAGSAGKENSQALSDLDNLAGINSVSLALFSDWAAAQSQVAFDDYYRRIHHSLATQQRDQLTQRAMLGAIEEVLRQAILLLDSLPFDVSSVPVERGRSALTPEIQKAFGGFLQKVLDDVIAFNRTSCALSNFPDEHELSKEYVQTILRDVAAAWKAFSLSANALLLAKSDGKRDRMPLDGVSAE